MSNLNIRILFLPIILTVSLMTVSCKKLIEVSSPATRIDEGNVYTDDVTATAVLTGIYTRIMSTTNTSIGFPTITRYAGLSADELDIWSSYNGPSAGLDFAYYRNALFCNPTSSPGSELWEQYYSFLFTCNAAIEGLNQSNSLTPSVKQQLLGEAKFLRALFYFYLINLYGDVPLVTSTDYKASQSLIRSKTDVIYEFIIADLKESQSLLGETYVDGKLKPYTTGNIERIRPNHWAATALLARAYLYKRDYVNSEIEATKIINQSSLFKMDTLNGVFLKNSSEAILQLQPVLLNSNVEDAKLFVLTTDPKGLSNSKPFYLSQSQINSFEAGDNRKTSWTGIYKIGTTDYYFPNKYKIATTGSTVTEYYTLFRLAEQYLIRAESKAMQGNLNDAISDINVIRKRARAKPSQDIPNPLPDLSTSLTKEQILSAILQERRVELFSELGHRWLDLKRVGKIDEIMKSATSQKGGFWESYQQLYPLPFSDVDRAINITQNTGY